MALYTASTSGRVHACAASVVLPHSRVPSGPEAEIGVKAHAVPEKYAKTGVWELPDGIKIDRAAIDELFASAGEIKAELVMSYDPDRDVGCAHPSLSARDYRNIPGIAGTADVVALGERLEVWDYKTGRYVPPAAESAQLKLLALMAARAYQQPCVTVRHVLIDTDTGAVTVDSAELDCFDLDAIADEVRSTVRKIEEYKSGTVVPVVNEGPHCKYCPAFRACPTKVALARTIFNGPTDLTALTPEVAGSLYLRAKDAQVFLDSIAKSLREYAEREPLVLPDGKRVELRSVTATRHKTVKTDETETYTYKKLQVVT